MKIIDNFLNEDNFTELYSVLMGDEFPWFYNKNVVYDNALCNELDHYQMTHRFYLDNVPSSGYWNIIQPLINKINPKSLIRAKANLIPRNQKIIRLILLRKLRIQK